MQKRLKDEGQAGLHFQMRIFLSLALRIAFEARGQRQGQVAPGGFVEESRGHAGANRMQLPFRQRPLQAEEEPTVGRGGIIQAIDIRNQAALGATEIQKGIPVRAIA